MSKISRGLRCWCAVIIWIFGLLLFFALGLWNVMAFRADAENRLISESGRVAAQLAGLLTHPGARFDESAARAIVGAAMEDDRVYAVKVETRDTMLAGQRRNYMWEPTAWDDEIAENCVQGMNPIRIAGRPEGKVDVWLSPRVNAEEEALLFDREILRFGIVAFVWTGIFCLLLWHWGDFRRLASLLEGISAGSGGEEKAPDRLVLGLAHAAKKPAEPVETGEAAGQPELVDANVARTYQRKHPQAWLVTAGLFRQTFARAPHLLNRLYADGETAGLCHLGHMLELAAPCIGAMPLQQAARRMQDALNDPSCEARAIPVEECCKILEQTLVALGGDHAGARGSEEGE